MVNFNKKIFYSLIFSLILFSFQSSFSKNSFSQETQPIATSLPHSSSLPPWRILKEKKFPFYKVQILTREVAGVPWGPETMKAVIYDLSGKVLLEIRNVIVEPDPKMNVQGWVPGTLLDLDRDGYEDLLLKTYSGGAHCCYQYHIVSLGKVLKKMAELRLQDCGETIQLKDLNQDGIWEILTCNASFTYLPNLPYALSPFPPLTFGLENGKYVKQDRKYPQVFDQDIDTEKKNLQEKGYSDGDVVQIVLDYLLSDRETVAWEEFEKLYVSPNKEWMRQTVQDKWYRYSGIRPETQPSSLPRMPETAPASAPMP